MITDYHAKLYAHELLRRCPSDSVERFTAALMDSQVDLNPHQVDAALFAFRSPLSKGAIPADEVGLGKTIEAGIVLSQKWAERKRKILLIMPSSLRKQWSQELIDKFYLPSIVLEAANFNKAIKSGKNNPFENDVIVICSFQFARNKAEYVRAINWDLVIFDEAHRLRNVYKSGNKIARELRAALDHAPKMLLTATPLQNSLMELYGLVSFIDEHAFGDLKSFRTQFSRLTTEDNFDDLKQRLRPLCKRTLRRQVLEYIRYTERKAYTQEFIPTDEEENLYFLVSDYLQRANLQALPSSQRTLMTLVLRKLLASSTFAIAGALDALANKLERRLKEDDKLSRAEEELGEDFETLDELVDELGDEGDDVPALLTPEERITIQQEINDLRSFFSLAMKISQNAKGESLLQALEVGFKMTTELGGAEKTIIFTESRRTQNYLVQLLTDAGYGDDIVLFNGSNSDPGSREIYANWKARYQGTDKISGSRTADTRAALVDYFRNTAKIMIATEAAAEGINLQFCSMVVNYDLPWNPQRIEQRIGRCHRYGQKHDVVVINFLNKNNAADQRVYQLLSEKFKLFSGVFGASDEVLGSIESGVDFEKRIVDIYQTCRTQDDIQCSFDALQAELSTEINENLRSTRQKLLENFDAEVAEKLNVYKVEATASLNKYEALLWDTTKHMLDGLATFDDTALTFRLNQSHDSNIPQGLYTLKRQDDLGHHYRMQHPLAQQVLHQAMEKQLPEAELLFDYSNTAKTISILEPLVGQSGTLVANRLTVSALESEDYVVVSAITHEGHPLDDEQARRLFNLPASIHSSQATNGGNIEAIFAIQKGQILSEIAERNATFFEEEMEKLERWASDLKIELEFELKELDREIKLIKKEARQAANLDHKVSLHKKAKELEKKRNEKRRHLFEAQDEIDERKENLIEQIERRLQQTVEEEALFSIRWQII
jgi:superfamily II DNA or RNA helicase